MPKMFEKFFENMSFQPDITDKETYDTVFKEGDTSSLSENEDTIDISYANDGSIYAKNDNSTLSIVGEGTIYSRQKSLVHMFSWPDSKLTTVDFGNGIFDTVAADSTYAMFAGCKSLTSLELYLLNTINVTNMANMFENVGISQEKPCLLEFVGLKDEMDVSSWYTNFKTINATTMKKMFYGSNVASTWLDVEYAPLNLIKFDVKILVV